MIALIPARAGSRRIPGKNTRLLAGHPLIAYTIAAAQESGVFEDIQIWTDDPALHQLAAERWAVKTYVRAPSEAGEADISWVLIWSQAATAMKAESFAILRPTSPFRTAETIRRAFDVFRGATTADSIRAVEPAKQHPGKMWLWPGAGFPLECLWPQKRSDGTPFHSAPMQSLPQVWVQNSSLEMAWTRNVTALGSIAGNKIAPFFTEGYEGFSIDYPEDWERAEQLIASGCVILPT